MPKQFSCLVFLFTFTAPLGPFPDPKDPLHLAPTAHLRILTDRWHWYARLFFNFEHFLFFNPNVHCIKSFPTLLCLLAKYVQCLSESSQHGCLAKADVIHCKVGCKFCSSEVIFAFHNYPESRKLQIWFARGFLVARKPRRTSWISFADFFHCFAGWRWLWSAIKNLFRTASL